MIHANRIFQVTLVADVDELAELLTQQTWTLCTAFELDGVLLCNDAFSENGAQEYALIRAGRQIESFTCSWMSEETFKECFAKAVAGNSDYGAAAPRLDHANPCPLCI